MQHRTGSCLPVSSGNFAQKLQLLLLQTCTEAAGLSAALHFDVIGAFDSAMRTLLHEDPCGGEEHERHTGGREPALSQAKGRDIISRIIANMHRHAFVTVEGIGKVLRTVKGVKPGDPLGGICLVLTMLAALKEAMAKLVQEGLVTDVAYYAALPKLGAAETEVRSQLDEDAEGRQHIRIPDISFIDGLAMLVKADKGESVSEKVRRTTAIMCSVLKQFGLDTNFSAGKTEAVFSLVGKGGTERRRWLADRGNAIKLEVDGQETVPRAVKEYVHLGTPCTDDGAVMPKIRRRTRVANTAVSDILKAMWKTNYVTTKAKGNIHHALLLPKLLQKAQIWLAIEGKELDALRTPHMRVLRAVFDIQGATSETGCSNAELIGRKCCGYFCIRQKAALDVPV